MKADSLYVKETREQQPASQRTAAPQQAASGQGTSAQGNQQGHVKEAEG
jgi:hypothetical protein